MSAECNKCGSDIVYSESTWPLGECEVCDLRARAETLREALIRCAEVAGVDGEAIAAARSGAMKYPGLAAFAILAVEELRLDYDGDQEGAKP